jgi:HPt (histidine-containing phosphotransfer) domain-containing protein
VKYLNKTGSRDPFQSKESMAMLRDMESSAAIIGADGLSRLAGYVAEVAKTGDQNSVRKAVKRCVDALIRIQTNVKHYLAKTEAREQLLREKEPRCLGGAVADNISGWPVPETAETEDPDTFNKKAADAATYSAGSRISQADTVTSPADSATSPAEDGAEDGSSQVDFEMGLSMCRGKATNYRRLLNYFSADLKGWIEILRKYPSADSPDLRAMTIIFHSMKSASAAIGAGGLSELAKKLEDAGRDEDEVFIRGNAKKCLSLMEKVFSRISEYLGSGS